MGRSLRRSWTGAAPVAVILSALAVGSARAGDAYSSQPPDGGLRPHPCGEGQTCAHISGYIKARSDAVGQPPLAAPPPLAAIGFGMNAVGQATSDALNHGMFFMRTSGDDLRR